MEQKHTAPCRLPLELAEAATCIPIKDLNGKTIATVKFGDSDLDYAKFIQRACNSHYELIDSCKQLLRLLGYYRKTYTDYANAEEILSTLEHHAVAVIKRAEATNA